MNANNYTLPDFDFSTCVYESVNYWNVYRFKDGTALIEREDDDCHSADDHLPTLFSVYYDGANAHIVVDDQIKYSFEYRLEDLIAAVEDADDDDAAADDSDDEPSATGNVVLNDAMISAIDAAARARRLKIRYIADDSWLVFFEFYPLEFVFEFKYKQCLYLEVERETTQVVLRLTKDPLNVLLPVIAPFMS